MIIWPDDFYQPVLRFLCESREGMNGFIEMSKGSDMKERSTVSFCGHTSRHFSSAERLLAQKCYFGWLRSVVLTLLSSRSLLFLFVQVFHVPL